MAPVRYETDAQVAGIIEAQWSDYFVKGDADVPVFDPIVDLSPIVATPSVAAAIVSVPIAAMHPARPSFFCEVAALTAETIRANSGSARSVGDVGGGAGRFLFEISKLFGGLEKKVLIEPSRRLADVAGRFLNETEVEIELPAVTAIRSASQNGSPRNVLPCKVRAVTPRHIDSRQTEICCTTLEEFPGQDEQFDLLACLNVMDRHPSPPKLISGLRSHLQTGGFLVLASPFEFIPELMPDEGDVISDMDEILAPGEWVTLAKKNVNYEVRPFERKLVRYCVQVVVARKA